MRMLEIFFALVMSAAGEPVGDPALAWLKPVIAKGGFVFDQEHPTPDRSTDFDGDGRPDTVVFLTRSLEGSTRQEHHAYLAGTRGWRGWLAWGSGDYLLSNLGTVWVFCFPGSGSGQGCSTVEFTSGQARVVKEDSGNAVWHLQCDYAAGVCTRCEPCERQDGQAPKVTGRPVKRWSAALPEAVAWTQVSTPKALLGWLEERSSRRSTH